MNTAHAHGFHTNEELIDWWRAAPHHRAWPAWSTKELCNLYRRQKHILPAELRATLELALAKRRLEE